MSERTSDLIDFYIDAFCSAADLAGYYRGAGAHRLDTLQADVTRTRIALKEAIERLNPAAAPEHEHEHVEPCDYCREVQAISELLCDVEPNHSHVTVSSHVAALIKELKAARAEAIPVSVAQPNATAADLKPCPFCGSEGAEETITDVNEGVAYTPLYRAVCRRCDFALPGARTYEEAAAQWNRRAPFSPDGNDVDLEAILCAVNMGAHLLEQESRRRKSTREACLADAEALRELSKRLPSLLARQRDGERAMMERSHKFAWAYGTHRDVCPLAADINAPDSTACSCGFDAAADALMNDEDVLGMDFWKLARASRSSTPGAAPDASTCIGETHVFDVERSECHCGALDRRPGTTDWATKRVTVPGIAAHNTPAAPDASTPEKRVGRKSVKPCEKCRAMEVYVTQDGDDADFTIHCYACGMHYRVDGPDA